jgi:hypothetical protein
VELALQIRARWPKFSEMVDMAADLLSIAAAHLVRPPMPSRTLAPAHVNRLLALLQGATAAAATAAYKREIHAHRGPSGRVIMVWLAEQPGAVAAAAELGLTAADVPDPAAVALLFGDQHHEEDAQPMA